ncbi:hypothetical protein [Pontiella sulfatireligans]|uniref:Uncharacterized protein n=1 Tax=Pontiella sulfatireligans TaxID=2750658 RepID=A0A6C2UEI2_9BACT|nr:hypothetical protein [Pontiella sulfatireligans]VGO18622.1 hypothetical protein SCARR_00675 [Pontiella sulfatireligans]
MAAFADCRPGKGAKGRQFVLSDCFFSKEMMSERRRQNILQSGCFRMMNRSRLEFAGATWGMSVHLSWDGLLFFRGWTLKRHPFLAAKKSNGVPRCSIMFHLPLPAFPVILSAGTGPKDISRAGN